MKSSGVGESVRHFRHLQSESALWALDKKSDLTGEVHGTFPDGGRRQRMDTNSSPSSKSFFDMVLMHLVPFPRGDRLSLVSLPSLPPLRGHGEFGVFCFGIT
jgi:hypothetical protein